MSQAPNNSLIKIAPIVFSLFLGGVGGYIFHASILTASGTTGTPGVGMGGMKGSPGPISAGGAGGGNAQPASGATLARTVRGLAMLQTVQHKGLTAEQTQKLLPLAQAIQTAERLPEKDAAEKLAAVEALLTEDQKQAIQELQPARGGRGGGGAPGGGGGMPGGAGGGGMPGSGGGQQDPDKPFASERNKKSLEDLLAALKQPAKS